MLVGAGARDGRELVLETAMKLASPMVLTLKAKEGLEDANEFQVGQAGLIGNPAAAHALECCEVLLMVGTDFPYRDSYPEGKTVIQIDAVGAHIGRRTPVDVGVVGDARLTLAGLLPLLETKSDQTHVLDARTRYLSWTKRHLRLADPKHDSHLTGRVRAIADNPGHAIRPEAVAAAIDRLAAPDAIFTSDTGMSTVWLARYVTMRGSRRLLGSYNLGSMANAMPQALGASALDRTRQVVAFCGDGGLSMLMGDLLTAVAYELPVKLVVFNNGRLGMVKLEQEQAGLPEFGTVLAEPRFGRGGTGLRAARHPGGRSGGPGGCHIRGAGASGAGAAGCGDKSRRGLDPSGHQDRPGAGLRRGPAEGVAGKPFRFLNYACVSGADKSWWKTQRRRPDPPGCEDLDGALA